MQMPFRSPWAELRRWQADLGGNPFGGKVLGIHFVFAQFVADSHLIQKASGVSLLCHCTPTLGAWDLNRQAFRLVLARSLRLNLAKRGRALKSLDGFAVGHTSLMPVGIDRSYVADRVELGDVVF